MLYEEEEALRLEDESYREAQIEAERAARVTMSLKEKSIDLQENHLPKPASTDGDPQLSLAEVEDDFADFLSKVRSRSEAFRSQIDDKTTTPSKVLLQRKPLEIENNSSSPAAKDKNIDLHTFSLSDDDDFELGDTEFDIGERMDPVGRETSTSALHNNTSTLSDLENFGFSDDEMGDFIRG